MIYLLEPICKGAERKSIMPGTNISRAALFCVCPCACTCAWCYNVDMYSCMCVHSRGAAMAATRANGARFASYNLPSLPYDVTALEPVREKEHR